MLEIYEVFAEEYDHLQRDPDARIETGVNDGSIARYLELYYHNNFTYVVPTGEFMNAEAWKHEGKCTPEQVRDDYLREVG